MSTSDFLDCYRGLKGSYGQVRLQLRQKLLGELCAMLKSQLGDGIEDIGISSSGTNRFRIGAKLSNSLYQSFGQSFLNILSENGIEIKITQSTAVPTKPWEGTLETGMVGKGVLFQIVSSINKWINDTIKKDKGGVVSRLDDDDDDEEDVEPGRMRQRVVVVQVIASPFSETRILFDPFPVLRTFLPAGMADHIKLIQWQTTADSSYIDFNWQHSG